MRKKIKKVLIAYYGEVYRTGDSPHFCNGCAWAHLYDRDPDDPAQPIHYYCERFAEWMETQDYYYRHEKCKKRIINRGEK